MYGTWLLGNDYRNRSSFYGAYPPGFLKRLAALFPDVVQEDIGLRGVSVIARDIVALIGKMSTESDQAHAAKLDRSCISGIERGVRNVSILKLAAVAKALGTSMSDLLPE